MRILRTLLLVVVCSFIAVAPSHAQGPATKPTSTTKRLHALFDAEWQRGLRESPESATVFGDHRYDDRWTDLSLAAIATRAAADRAALAQLRAIPRGALSAADQLHRDTLEWQLSRSVERQRFAEHLLPLTHQRGPQQADDISQLMPFNNAADYRQWLARMAAVPTLVEQTVALMQQGLKAGLTPPRVLMDRVPAQIAAQVVSEATQSPFYRPLLKFPDTIAATERADLQREAQALIREQIVPAFSHLQRYLADEYLPRTRTSIAATERPDAAEGRAYYDFLAAYYTTTPLSAEQIHQTGLQEVARLRAAMDKVKEETGFKGSMAEFFQHLRRDPKFFKTTPAELLDSYRALSKRIDPELVKISKHIPRLPYGVRAIAEHIAPDSTTAYYQPGADDGSRPGYYYVNLFRPEVRPLWEMVPLSLHEAVPGHHFQIARAAELRDMPTFRRHAYFVAYGEGWALYAEKLGYDMGLYDDPYDRFGQLTYEMWRAVRLVVDTGMHSKGWSRERAMAYFTEHAAKTEQDIVNEIDRYIGDPGQALAYKVGEMVISDLRAQATREMGVRWDLRDFNDEVLATGSVPLPVLQRHMQAWIARRVNARSP
jgi:uncharacterized protein (DUF885 family)